MSTNAAPMGATSPPAVVGGTLLDLTALDPSLRIDGHLPECRSQHQRRTNDAPTCDWCLWAIEGVGVRSVVDAVRDASALTTEYDRRCGDVSVPWVVAATDLLGAEHPRPDGALLASTADLLDRLLRVLADTTEPLEQRVDLAVASGGPVERRCLATAGPLAAAALQRPEHAGMVELLPHAARAGVRRATELLSADHQTSGLLPLVEQRHWDGVPTLRTQPAWTKRPRPQTGRAGPAPGSLEALVMESVVDVVTDLLDEVANALAGDLSTLLPRVPLDRRGRGRMSDRTRWLTWRIARVDWPLTFADTGRADCWAAGDDDGAGEVLLVPWTVALAIAECEGAGLVSATHRPIGIHDRHLLPVPRRRSPRPEPDEPTT